MAPPERDSMRLPTIEDYSITSPVVGSRFKKDPKAKEREAGGRGNYH